ncbi:FRG domain-containing protein [Candidatus Sumerlaeota bacterium]|nr:FRG domain-containing protein [Candidatus Sumerlaeota bacterium]
MQEMKLNSWAEFPNAIAKVRAKSGTHSILCNGQQILLENEILFRGQPDSEWNLKTTLERATERATHAEYSIERYLQRADSVVNEIESLTGKKWQLPPYPEIVKEIEESQGRGPHLPHYDYLVYLRHHGFPSPLLDWTSSPYIAAYFALEPLSDAERCSVFAFIETPEGRKSASPGWAGIKPTGPYVTTDIRHFAQKARYTFSTRWDEERKTYYFCSHHSEPPPHSIVIQDVLIKITFPRSDRIAALRQLEDYNINHYTLFQSEDSLVRSLGIRAFDLEARTTPTGSGSIAGTGQADEAKSPSA